MVSVADQYVALDAILTVISEDCQRPFGNLLAISKCVDPIAAGIDDVGLRSTKLLLCARDAGQIWLSSRRS